MVGRDEQPAGDELGQLSRNKNRNSRGGREEEGEEEKRKKEKRKERGRGERGSDRGGKSCTEGMCGGKTCAAQRGDREKVNAMIVIQRLTFKSENNLTIHEKF